MKVKLIDLTRQHETISASVERAILKTARNGQFILGEQVARFEQNIATFVGTKGAVGVNSGTDALMLALRALNIGSGDEVITTPFSFIATAEAVAAVGARPVFVDIDPVTFNLDASLLQKAITKHTKAIMPVHLYGQMADMNTIMRVAKKHTLSLSVVEDAAQALGASMDGKMAGSIGHAGCFSFFPTKNLGAYGDAGMITVNDPVLKEKLKMLRNHGSRKKYHHEFLGVSSRLDALQAAILEVKLKHLDRWNKRRRKIADQYTKAFAMDARFVTPYVRPGAVHIYHQYTLRAKDRSAFIEYLTKKGIETAVHYPLPLHLQPAFSYLGYTKGDFPHAEKAAEEVVSLPVYPELTSDEIAYVIKQVLSYHS